MRRAVICANAAAADTLVADIQTAMGLPRQLAANEVERPGGLYHSALPTIGTWPKLGPITVPVAQWLCDAYGGQGSTPIPAWNHASIKWTEPRMCPYGNSIDLGGADTNNDGYKEGLYTTLTTEGYRPDLVGQYRAGVFADAEHSAISGETIEQIQARASADVFKYAPEIVVTYGLYLNNVATDDAATILTKIEAWARHLRSLLPNVFVSVSKGYRRNHEAKCATVNDGLATAMTAAGFSASRYDVDNPAIADGDTADGVHLTAAGHDKVRDSKLPALRTRLAEAA